MSESRKNHLTIDGGQVKEDDKEHIGSYKPIPQGDGDFRKSRSSLEKASPDGASERLLQETDRAKIATRIDMTDAKFVVGDHRNGDAKVELDATKRQFSGLTKEELLRYQDDPFWVRLRWTLFILFWLMWLCMLAGAITIIFKTPKCTIPKNWYETGPLVDMGNMAYSDVEESLFKLNISKVPALVVKVESYPVLDDEDKSIETFKNLLEKAKNLGIKLIVDLIPNYVSKNSTWFKQSENRSAQYDSYFTWANGTGYNEQNERKPPTNWVGLGDRPAWSFSKVRGQFYLNQFDENTADLNFANKEVVKHFEDVLQKWMEAGAAGVRLRHARQLFFSLPAGNFSDELPAQTRPPPAAVHTMYQYWEHKHSSDLPQLTPLMQHWSHLVKQFAGEKADATVFTVLEEDSRWSGGAEWALRPPAGPAVDPADLPALANKLNNWPALHIKSGDGEVGLFSLLLPATVLLDMSHLEKHNETGISKLVSLRKDPCISDGRWLLESRVNSSDTEPLIAIVRWKDDRGFVGIYNAHSAAAHAALDRGWSPADLTLYHVSEHTQRLTNYTVGATVHSDNVLVPAKSTVVLSFTPKSPTEK